MQGPRVEEHRIDPSPYMETRPAASVAGVIVATTLVQAFVSWAAVVLPSIAPEFGRASYTTTKRALEAMSESLAHDLRGRVAVNCLRIDVPVYSEGFEATLPPDWSGYEDAVVVSDAVSWLVSVMRPICVKLSSKSCAPPCCSSISTSPRCRCASTL